MEHKGQRRPYNSTLREKQAALTRQRILETFEEQLVENGFQDLTLPQVARRAGVSVPTVYRYFPTMEALQEAFAWRATEKLGFPLEVTSPDELPELVQKLFESFDRNAPLMRAILNTSTGRQVHAHRREERLETIQKFLSELTTDMSPEEARRVHAVFKLFFSGPAWQYLRDHLSLGGPEAGKAAAWVVQALLNELRRGEPEG